MPSFSDAITLVHDDRGGHRRDAIDGVHRAAKSGGYCTAKSPLANVFIYTGGSPVSTDETKAARTIKANQPCAICAAKTAAMVA